MIDLAEAEELNICEWFESKCHKAKYALERKLIDFALECASGEVHV